MGGVSVRERAQIVNKGIGDGNLKQDSFFLFFFKTRESPPQPTQPDGPPKGGGHLPKLERLRAFSEENSALRALPGGGVRPQTHPPPAGKGSAGKGSSGLNRRLTATPVEASGARPDGWVCVHQGRPKEEKIEE